MNEAVAVALIASVFGPTLLALLNRSAYKDVDRKLGNPNGHGSLVGMVQHVIDGQAGQDRRLARLEEKQTEQTEAHAAMARRLDHVEHHLEKIGEFDTLGREGRIERRSGDA